MKNVTPYNTGKVKIGLLYRPENRYEADFDAVRVQDALLYRPLPLWQRIKYFLGLI